MINVRKGQVTSRSIKNALYDTDELLTCFHCGYSMEERFFGMDPDEEYYKCPCCGWYAILSEEEIDMMFEKRGEE